MKEARMAELHVDAETMKMAIVLTVKKNVDKLFKKAQEIEDLREAANIYREIGAAMDQGADQLASLIKQKEGDES